VKKRVHNASIKSEENLKSGMKRRNANYFCQLCMHKAKGLKYVTIVLYDSCPGICIRIKACKDVTFQINAMN
jgi:hypothetical protein